MAKKKEKEIEKPKIRIKLKAYDHKVIDNSARQIIEIVEKYGGKIIGPIPLPTEIHRYTVNRDSFVHKDAREQFEIRIHKRLIEVEGINQKMVDALQNLTLPAGVDIEIKI